MSSKLVSKVSILLDSTSNISCLKSTLIDIGFTQCKKDINTVITRNVVIELYENKYISSYRRLFKLPYIAVVSDIQLHSISDSGTVSATTVRNAFTYKDYQACMVAHPYIQPSVSMYNSTNSDDTTNNNTVCTSSSTIDVNDLNIKEIVMPYSTRIGDYLTTVGATARKTHTGVYFKDNIAYRLMPTSSFSIIIKVDDIHRMKEVLDNAKASTSNSSNSNNNNKVKANILGKSGSNNGNLQLQLLPSIVTREFLDIRMCESSDILPYYNDNAAVLLEDTIHEVQNSQVLGGSDGAAIDKRILKSDCWMEIKEMAKRPTRFTYSNSNGRVVTPPSIHE